MWLNLPKSFPRKGLGRWGPGPLPLSPYIARGYDHKFFWMDPCNPTRVGYNRGMKVTRTSFYSGITRTLDLDITEAQMEAYQTGTLIQNAFPDLSDADREFIITGVTGEEWIEMFGDISEDEA